MWNKDIDSDILDYALLWEPLGGATPNDVSIAFSIEFADFSHRLKGAVRRQVDRLQHGGTTPDIVYGLSAITTLVRDQLESNRFGVSRTSGGCVRRDRETAYAVAPGSLDGNPINHQRD
ncbi:hypothetical protein JWS13_30945 [Rhodococcus pseudokoreensis]|uniref:Uncharacterized protein n=1 Tax=Rhodococcus pseudokoreensis TaxID=2811421 RepID=A0A974W7I8_9NOCA|nr:hypothetical protein [Rhodococcus pseudokoreensis]QSE92713.1 hypothetical protein JWS13_30945 [Rhodococcus pseudokoreensis]